MLSWSVSLELRYYVFLTPKLSVSICKLHVPIRLEYHEAAFALSVSHKARYAYLWWYTQRQLDVIRAYFPPLYYVY